MHVHYDKHLLCVKFSYKKALYATVAVTLNILFFVYVSSRCIVNNHKKISKMLALLPLEKFLRTPMPGTSFCPCCSRSEEFVG